MAYDGEKFAWENRHVRSQKVCIGEVLYEPGGVCGPRVQQDFQLVFLHSGGVSVRVDDRLHNLSVSRVALFLPGHREHFQFSSSRPTHHSWCAVHPTLMPPRLRTALKRAPFSVPCSEVINRLLATGLAIGSGAAEGSRPLVEHVGLSLFAEYLEIAERDTDGKLGDQVVSDAVRFLSDHLDEPDCLLRVHQAVGVSRNTLIQRFRRDLKTTPARYLWRLRTERGIELLAATGHTVAEIAYKCGFQNPFHFSRLVRNLQGISPRAIRQRAWRGGRRSSAA